MYDDVEGKEECVTCDEQHRHDSDQLLARTEHCEKYGDYHDRYPRNCNEEFILQRRRIGVVFHLPLLVVIVDHYTHMV